MQAENECRRCSPHKTEEEFVCSEWVFKVRVLLFLLVMSS